MTTYRTLAIVDDVTTCDCCGKSNLLRTVAMERDDGEIVHFGSVCATRHSGRDAKTIKYEAAAEMAHIIAKVRAELTNSPEYVRAQVRMAQATRECIRPGVAFMEFCKEANAEARAKQAEIAAKYNIPVWLQRWL